METGNGLIEVGLCFSHVSSQLRIHVISAQKLRAVNLHGGHSGIVKGSISSMFYYQLFTLTDPESTIKTFKLSIFFALLGSVCAKAAHRLLTKLTPDRLCQQFEDYNLSIDQT